MLSLTLFNGIQNGQLKAVVGGSGGIKILTTVAQVLLNILDGYDPLSAVSRPRIHHQVCVLLKCYFSWIHF